jgi:hypothetical protein
MRGVNVRLDDVLSSASTHNLRCTGQHLRFEDLAHQASLVVVVEFVFRSRCRQPRRRRDGRELLLCTS